MADEAESSSFETRLRTVRREKGGQAREPVLLVNCSLVVKHAAIDERQSRKPSRAWGRRWESSKAEPKSQILVLVEAGCRIAVPCLTAPRFHNPALP